MMHTTGTPSATPMCRGPVSLVSTSDAREYTPFSAPRSSPTLSGYSLAAALRTAAAAASSPGPTLSITRQPRSASTFITVAKRSGGHSLLGPNAAPGATSTSGPSPGARCASAASARCASEALTGSFGFSGAGGRPITSSRSMKYWPVYLGTNLPCPSCSRSRPACSRKLRPSLK